MTGTVPMINTKINKIEGKINDLMEVLLSPVKIKNEKCSSLPNGSNVASDFHDNPENENDLINWKVDVFQSSDQWMAILSNFSTSYNVVNISMVLPILESMVSSKTESNSDQASSSLCASSLLGGMIVGQLAGGWLGDVLGRLNALSVVMSVQLFASLGSSIFVPSHQSNNDLDRVLGILAIWRFVLGMGAGGVYPLAALLSEESSGNISKDKKNKIMSFVFASQGVAFCLVPLLTFVLLQIFASSSDSKDEVDKLNIVWRLILGFGAIPSVVLIIILLNKRCRGRYAHTNVPSDDEVNDSHHEDTPGFIVPSATNESIHDDENQSSLVQVEENNQCPSELPLDYERESNILDSKSEGLWQSISNEPQIVRKLIGTALTWFLFDLLFYGNTLFQPIVLKAAFGNTHNRQNSDSPIHSLNATAIRSILINVIAIPGYVLSFLLMGKKCLCLCNVVQTPKWIQTQGFIFMAVLYSIISGLWNELRSSSSNAAWLLVLYGGTFFFANYGPNTTTFIMPSIVYSPSCTCRSTLNGICAAAGKFGALLGATFFAPLSDAYGDQFVMGLCALISMIAAILTSICVPVNNH